MSHERPMGKPRVESADKSSQEVELRHDNLRKDPDDGDRQKTGGYNRVHTPTEQSNKKAETDEGDDVSVEQYILDDSHWVTCKKCRRTLHVDAITCRKCQSKDVPPPDDGND